MKIWSNASLAPAALADFHAGIIAHERVERARDANVLFGLPTSADIAACTRLEWLHLIRAGYDRYESDWPALRARGVAVTTSSPVYAEPCAEHLLAMMMANARELPAALDNQRGKKAWPQDATRARQRLLAHSRVLLLGGGMIAQRLAQLLAPFAADVRIVRRAAGAYTADDLPTLLPWADHVVNALPGGEATRGYVSRERIARLRTDAFFYNIGRGTTVDELALADACRAEKIAGAYLDVFETEPLPPEHPLWTTPRVFITPHSAGGRTDEEAALVALFVDNLARFSRGEPLVSRVL